jgi:hypothetical protein
MLYRNFLSQLGDRVSGGIANELKATRPEGGGPFMSRSIGFSALSQIWESKSSPTSLWWLECECLTYQRGSGYILATELGLEAILDL